MVEAVKRPRRGAQDRILAFFRSHAIRLQLATCRKRLTTGSFVESRSSPLLLRGCQQ